MSQSVPYLLSASVYAALRAEFEASGAAVRDNPTTPAELDLGERVFFIEDDTDRQIDKPGQSEGRFFSLRVGVINRSAGARAGADADMQAAKAVVTRAMRDKARDLMADRIVTAMQYPREMERTYRHERIDVGGALILTRFEIDYRLPPPTRPAA